MSSPDPLTPCPEDIEYPAKLRERETIAIEARRKVFYEEPQESGQNGTPKPGKPAADTVFAKLAEERKNASWETNGIGVALSGGGIRSATFSLGVLQAMAETRFLRLIDFLSTVSGGSFIGSFLGRHYLRREEINVIRPTDKHDSEIVEDLVSTSTSDSVYWLRQNGRYLTPRGGGDIAAAIAGSLRDLLTIQVFLGVFIMTMLLGAQLVRAYIEGDLYGNRGAELHSAGANDVSEDATIATDKSPAKAKESQSENQSTNGNVPNPEEATRGKEERSTEVEPTRYSYIPDTLHFRAESNPSVGAESNPTTWTERVMETIRVPFIAALAVFIGLGFLYWVMNYVIYLWPFWEQDRVSGKVARWRREFTDVSAYLLIAAVFFAILRFVDRAGAEIFLSQGQAIAPTLAGISAAVSALVSVAGRFWSNVFFPSDDTPTSVSRYLRPIATGAGLLVVTCYLIALSVLGYWLTSQFEQTQRLLTVSIWDTWMYFAIFGVVMVGLGGLVGIVDLTTLHRLYTARLTRAYLGASNPKRWSAKGKGITDPDPGDNVAMTDYMPYKHGGPLHIVCTTMNETVSGESQIEYRDRKGLPVAVSALGMSVGVSHHAEVSTEEGQRGIRLRRIDARDKSAPKSDQPKDPVFQIFPSTSTTAEALTLAEWVGISGAAVCTGMGSRTNLGLSMVLAFFNVRLGYWWDSGISPRLRDCTPWVGSKKIVALFDWVFFVLLKAYGYFLSEFLGRFHGPAKRRWNLSDGGHFENTGVYELIRRRLPLIIALDNGADPSYQFADLGNVVRRARTDFGAKIEFVQVRPDKNGSQKLGAPPNHSVALVNALAAHGSGFFGNLDEIDNRRNDGRRFHAAIATIEYKDKRVGTLIWVKPSLNGDEASDVLQYHDECTSFPQESTADQFFDEAQWESYRELGHHIGNELMAILTKMGEEGLLNPSPTPARVVADSTGSTGRASKGRGSATKAPSKSKGAKTHPAQGANRNKRK